MSGVSDKPLRVEENEVATIPFYAHESAMAHKDRDNKRMRDIVIAICVTFVIVIITFVTGYSIRTKYWLDTIASMNRQSVEVTNATETP